MKNVVLLLLLAASLAMAQMNISTGSISGTVADSSGQIIPGALVTLTYEFNGEVRTQTTNSTGDFIFPALVEGSYTVRLRPKDSASSRRRATSSPPARAWRSIRCNSKSAAPPRQLR